MRFASLGTVVVTKGGRPLPLRGHVERRLLAALLVHANDPVADPVLARWVWGDADDDGWRNRLQTAVSRLNKTLSSGAPGRVRIRRESGGYRLVVGADEYDVFVFERYRRAAEEALAMGDAREAVTLADLALGEWRGRAFGDLAEERFVHERAGTLDAHRLATEQLRIEALLRLNEKVEECVAGAKALVASEPGNERLLGLLMRALYRSGRPDEALRAYRAHRDDLVERTGREPGSELQRLEVAVLDNDPSLDWTPVGGPTGGHPDRPTALRTFLLAGQDEGESAGAGDGQATAAARTAPASPLEAATTAHGGRVFSPAPDLGAVFEGSPLDAVLAARDAAVALRRAGRETGRAARVRLAVHTGEAEARAQGPGGERYTGSAVTRVARMRDAGHPGQVLVSAATRELVAAELPEDVELVDIGAWQFDGFPRPERLYQLTHEELMTDFPPLRAGRPHTGQLPRYTTPFLGRERQVTEVATLLAEHPLVTVTGDGGIGKTRLALEVAQRASTVDFPDGVWYCDVSLADDPDALVERVAAARGLVLTYDSDHREHLVRSLRATRLLLVLDGCERLRGPVAELVREVVASGSEVRLLVTSRAPLHDPAEQVVKLDPLPVPGPSDPEPETAAAVQLLHDLADRAGGAVARTDPHLVELARRLDGLPLALELAAPRLASLSPATLVERIDSSLETFTGAPGAPARHRTLRATFDWSFELVSPAARRLLAALSLFRGSWTIETAEAVAPAVDVEPGRVMAHMAELVDQSLVRVDMPAGGIARYTMLDTIGTYAAERLFRARRYDAVADLHAAHFLALAERAVPHRRGPDEPAWVGRLLTELDNLRAAYRRFIEAGRPCDALRLVVALADDLLMRERLEIERWAVEVAALPAVAREPLRATALGLAACGSLLRGRLEEAHERAAAALRAEAETGAPPSWMARNALAFVTVTGESPADWRDHLAAMGEISDATGDPFPRAVALWDRTLVHTHMARPDRAAGPAADLRALGDRYDNPSIRAMGLLMLGRVAALRHDPDEARDLLHQALGAAEAAHNTLVLNHSMRDLADLDARSGDPTAVLATLRRIARSFADSGNVSEQLQTVMSMVEHLVALGELVPAAMALGALSRTPMAETVRYQALAALVTDRLPAGERHAAQRRGSALELREVVPELLRAVDHLPGGGRRS